MTDSSEPFVCVWCGAESYSVKQATAHECNENPALGDTR